MPDLALIDVDPEIGRREPDQEVQDLVSASAGLNLAMDFLPGSIGYDRSFDVPVGEAAAVVWLDAFVANVDRSRRNTNLLDLAPDAVGHRPRRLPPFHHSWGDPRRFADPRTTTATTCSAGSGARGTSRRAQRAGHAGAAVLDPGRRAGRLAGPGRDRPDPRRRRTRRCAKRYGEFLLARLAAADRWLP